MNTTIVNGHRIASDSITQLAEGEIFVFGSNIQGNFGAEWGVGEGLTGRTYALPTMEGKASLTHAVKNFTACAKKHPKLTFLVTAVGCGIAGYSPLEVAPLFAEAATLENVYLPQVFVDVLG